MRRLFLTTIATCSFSFGLSPALAGPTISPTPAVSPTLDLTEVTLRVVWSKADEIASMRERYEGLMSVRDRLRRVQQYTGFAVLTQDAEGRYTCTLYVERPRRVDDQRTRVLGHELLHCLAGRYHD